MTIDATEIYPGLHEWDYDPVRVVEETEFEQWIDSCGLQPDNTCEYVGLEECEFMCPWHRAVGSVSAPKPDWATIDRTGLRMALELVTCLWLLMKEQTVDRTCFYAPLNIWRWASSNAIHSHQKAPWFIEPEPDFDDIPF